MKKEDKKLILVFVTLLIINLATFAGTTYYYETKIGKDVVVEGLFANVFADESIGEAPLAVNFSALVFNTEGKAKYRWDFGDGNTSNETRPTYNYTKEGNYTCTLTITDESGANISTSIKILIVANRAPTVVALVTPSSGPRYDKPIWLLQLARLPLIGDQIVAAVAKADILSDEEGWITCEAQPSDPEGDEIVLYEWELRQPVVSSLTGRQEFPVSIFSGEDMVNITFPMIDTFRLGSYDAKVTVTDSAGNKASSQVRFNVQKSNRESMIDAAKYIWDGWWGPNFDFQLAGMQERLIKIWKIIGPIQMIMDKIVDTILAPLPPDLRDMILGLYDSIWESQETKYHKPNHYAPAAPSDPTPADNSSGVSKWINLSWNCSDGDGDPLKYDIYLGRDSAPPLVRSDYKGTTYDIGEEPLYPDTKYYWKIVVTDIPTKGAYGGVKTVEGPVWSFTTAP